jgi:hypothetical protein
MGYTADIYKDNLPIKGQGVEVVRFKVTTVDLVLSDRMKNLDCFASDQVWRE